MQLGDRLQPRIGQIQLHHLDEGTARLGAAVQQVVAAALGAPAPAAEPEEAQGILNRRAHGAAAGGVGHDRKPATIAVSAAFAALAAALCWTVASLLWRRIPTSLSGAQLNLLKNLIALALQLPLLVLVPWSGDGRALLLLALSGAIGIAAGDSLYFAALRRLGTRRTLTLDSGGPEIGRAHV